VRDIFVAIVRIEGNERRKGERKVLRHLNRFNEERQKLFTLASRHTSEESRQAAKCAQLQALSGRQQDATQVFSADDSRNAVASPDRADSSAQIVELAERFRAIPHRGHLRPCPPIGQQGADPQELRPRAVAIAKPLGKIDQDVGGVLIASQRRKLVFHRGAEETRPDDAFEAFGT
jgi:hypothetical protein